MAYRSVCLASAFDGGSEFGKVGYTTLGSGFSIAGRSRSVASACGSAARFPSSTPIASGSRRRPASGSRRQGPFCLPRPAGRLARRVGRVDGGEVSNETWLRPSTEAWLCPRVEAGFHSRVETGIANSHASRDRTHVDTRVETRVVACDFARRQTRVGPRAERSLVTQPGACSRGLRLRGSSSVAPCRAASPSIRSSRN